MQRSDVVRLGIPAELTARGKVLFDQTFWPAEAALATIDWLEANGVAVVGVERWVEVNRLPKWQGASDYDHELSGDWAAYVELCAVDARAYVQRHAELPDALFALGAMRAGEGAPGEAAGLGGGGAGLGAVIAWFRRRFGG